MFGLAASMSFGFGSFLATAAAPDPSETGTAVKNQTMAQIDEEIKAGIYIYSVKGLTINFNGNKQSIIDTSSLPEVKYYKQEAGGAITEDSSYGDADLGNVAIYLRARAINNDSEPITPANEDNDSGWVKVWTKADGFLENNANRLLDVQVKDVGKYKFYYYVDDGNANQSYNSNGEKIQTPGGG